MGWNGEKPETKAKEEARYTHHQCYRDESFIV